ncbi:hypothetical protein CEUSTIGMA_g3732.t1 [Chlamydomonas eustigma]|uniref:Nucleotide-diphospho-sugar transferase domain-containing protein n=1 Tax=Chlamydomonas eustigma TaxID=1157962 RepID=A0A250WZM2_9CHLO|nr:hypothetical protein CEUSTIGMA_g3732.t1 [Chlamydomonas eustigma]|eukprot:GAX76287.1 hypothetical protein CEUSTIGMA_g3732.t1 [Chlamydomonas eustigma]
MVFLTVLRTTLIAILFITIQVFGQSLGSKLKLGEQNEVIDVSSTKVPKAHSAVGWIGDVSKASNLASALASCAHGKEVILLADLRVEAAHQAYSLLAQQSSSHVLLLTLDRPRCKSSQSVLPALSCCWSSMTLPPGTLQGTKRLLILRIVIAARIIAQGYNLMLMDTDAMNLRDPYQVLKAPPFSSFNLIMARGAAPRTASSSALYIQNAEINGPVALLMEELAVRMIRWAEYGADGSASTHHLSGSSTQKPVHTSSAVRKLLGSHRLTTYGNRGVPVLGTDMGNNTSSSKANRWECTGSTEGRRRSHASVTGTKRSVPALNSGSSSRTDISCYNTSSSQRALLMEVSYQGPRLLKAFHAMSPTGCAESSLMTDVLLSSLTGRSIHLHCMKPTTAMAGPLGLQVTQVPAACKQWEEEHAAALGLLDSGGTRALFKHTVLKSQDMEDMVMAKSYTIHHAALNQAKTWRATGSEGAWVLEDNEVYNALSRHPTGQSVVTLKELLAADRGLATSSSSYPKPIAVDNSKSRQQVKASLVALAALHANSSGNQNESFAFAPDWLFGTWTDRGALGLWEPKMAGKEARQVIALLTRAPGSGGAGRDAVRMAYGYYDWDVVHKTGLMVGASTGPGALPKLVTFTKNLTQRLAKRSKKDWQAALMGLAKVAAITGRIPVWPDPPCNTQWLGSDPASTGRLPLLPNLKVIPYGYLSDLRCVPQEYLSTMCLHVFSNTWSASPLFKLSNNRARPVRGMLEVEANHVVMDLLPHQSGTENPKNTVEISEENPLKPASVNIPSKAHWWSERKSRRLAMSDDSGLSLPFTHLGNLSSIIEAIGHVSNGYGSKMDSETIVYLSNVVTIQAASESIDDTLQHLRSKCPMFK